VRGAWVCCAWAAVAKASAAAAAMEQSFSVMGSP
jgi:hypothetical protein